MEPQKLIVEVCSAVVGVSIKVYRGVYVVHSDGAMHLFTLHHDENKHVISYPYATLAWWREFDADDEAAWYIPASVP